MHQPGLELASLAQVSKSDGLLGGRGTKVTEGVTQVDGRAGKLAGSHYDELTFSPVSQNNKPPRRAPRGQTCTFRGAGCEKGVTGGSNPGRRGCARPRSWSRQLPQAHAEAGGQARLSACGLGAPPRAWRVRLVCGCWSPCWTSLGRRAGWDHALAGRSEPLDGVTLEDLRPATHEMI